MWCDRYPDCGCGTQSGPHSCEGSPVVTRCPWCQEDVTTMWTHDGCLSSDEYVLVADWAFHAKCYDAMTDRADRNDHRE
jgi:hypothetical protein